MGSCAKTGPQLLSKEEIAFWNEGGPRLVSHHTEEVGTLGAYMPVVPAEIYSVHIARAARNNLWQVEVKRQAHRRNQCVRSLLTGSMALGLECTGSTLRWLQQGG